MRLTIDENLPPSWCEFLTQEGYETHHWKDLGSCGDPDDLILDYAQAHQTIILTQDLDFTRLLALRGSGLPTVIQLRNDCPIPSIIGSAVLQVLSAHKVALESGALVSLELDRHRIRLLPLR